ncbi:chemotaxis protein CheW [Leptolyngbya cf. ectocarpi LEGE 11479]|uniref:Chemotaxis protein CheW n=1 Tax=Leptolyngbya cf. ectocarpi LEGE 11479 TaxID=1828722 RepID=A0A928X2S5_LEPEC|nr:chemotaxis protein CheW [Leptolyngbya ectocarpi]MBE9066003.1 chemotaxis protein CheW [Leptolyngbya cf. ectocarpi LEGE 11479]
METLAYLIFELDDLQYGIETTHVREIFQLPELTPIADTPDDMIGILNLRGKILPVMHLAKRLGQDHLSCQLTDSIIVVEWQGLRVGMVVNRVHDVQSLPIAGIEPASSYECRDYGHTAFAAGVAKMDDWLVMLLNPETLIRQPDKVALMAWEAKLNNLDNAPDSYLDSYLDNHSDFNHADQDIASQDVTAYPNEQIFEAQQTSVLTNFFSLYCPQATPADRQIFYQRAIVLRQSLEESDISQLIPLAVIQLGEDYFGINLQQVREFINIRRIRPIPCCPPHVMGNMNLRGDVMTLVDIRPALNLPQSLDASAKAVVIDVDDIVASIAVDQVLDMVYLPSSDISPMPTARRRQTFFQGVTRYYQKTLSILDLSKILSHGGLIVDQAA